MSNLHANQVTAGTIVTTTELAVVTLTAVNVSNPQGEGVVLSGDIAVTPGTSTTAVTVRVRQGNGITGTVVGAPIAYPVTAAVPNIVSLTVLDPTLLAAGQQWTLTIQQTAASANGSVQLGTITAQSATAVE